MKTRTSRLLLVLFVAIALAGGLTVAYVVVRSPGGAPTAQAAVDGYLTALADRDRAELAKLVDRDNVSDTEIDRRLRLYSGGQLVVTDRQFGDSTNDNVKGATLTGRLGGAPFTEQLTLNRHRDHWRYRWFLEFGPRW
jgi:hypothetical protein